MKPIKESDKLSLTESKKILNKNGIKYTDDEIIEIRNWMYYYLETVFDLMEKKPMNDLQEELKQLKRQKAEKKTKAKSDQKKKAA